MKPNPYDSPDGATPEFTGIWRTDSAILHFKADGTYETLHAPSTGRYHVMCFRDREGHPLESKTGYILVMFLDPPFGTVRPRAVYLIDKYEPDRVTLRVPGDIGNESLTLHRDNSS